MDREIVLEAFENALSEFRNENPPIETYKYLADFKNLNGSVDMEDALAAIYQKAIQDSIIITAKALINIL